MKGKIAIITIAILVLVNLVSLWLISTHCGDKPERPRQEDRMGQRQMNRFFAKELNMSEDQLQQFKELSRAHRMTTRQLSRQLHQTKKEAFDELFKEHPDTLKVKALFQKVGGMESALGQSSFEHFWAVKQLLNAEQQQRMQELFSEIGHHFGPPGKFGRGKGKGQRHGKAND